MGHEYTNFYCYLPFHTTFRNFACLRWCHINFLSNLLISADWFILALSCKCFNMQIMKIHDIDRHFLRSEFSLCHGFPRCKFILVLFDNCQYTITSNRLFELFHIAGSIIPSQIPSQVKRTSQSLLAHCLFHHQHPIIE